jgi:2-C-methyl-D-erythritol 4-phosphate cytidylyltransferase/2-C-methyl-D-erythritol 2,4-cyclodiphosphate synthase
MTQVSIIIVAAGRGQRAGEGLPKQYRMLCGMTVLRRTVLAFRHAAPEAHILCVIHPDDRVLYDAATKGLELPEPVHGGATRQDSVYRGLTGVKHLSPDYVLVHDAARPFMDQAVYDGVMQALVAGGQAVVPGVPVTDTLKHAPGGEIDRTVDRTDLYAVQTPQGFPFPALLAAHEAAPHKNFTDDAAVMEAAGVKALISPGAASNFKLTTAADFTRAEERLMQATIDVRVGSGYDVHRFEDGNHVWLCGVQVPHNKGLKGHSDADVGLHALTDALLSAIADGDIGTHFPPSDDQWRGAPSDRFLTFARDRIRDRGGIIAHVTVCLICERPKIGPHKDVMRTRIADLLQVGIDRVSVQATTTERLGFTGREEGIAAQATATVRLPLGTVS